MMVVHPDLGYFDEGLDLRDPNLLVGASRPFGEASRLPSVAYRSKVFADLEDEMIWTRSWVALGLQQQIPEPGDILPYTVGNHGIHVQRNGDLSLIGRFNKAQHGGCRAVPLQCQTGNKTKCSFTSCGYSRDRDEIRSQEVHEARQIAHQYLGLVPERLLPVQVAAVGPIVFANLDAGSAKQQSSESWPFLKAAQDGKSIGEIFRRSHFECAANWKVVMRALGEPVAEEKKDQALWREVEVSSANLQTDHLPEQRVASGHPVVDFPVLVHRKAVCLRPLDDKVPSESLGSLWWHFPNLMMGCFDSHVMVLIVQPVGLALTRLRYFLLYPDQKENADVTLLERADRAWQAHIGLQLSSAELVQKEIQTWGTAASPRTREECLPLEQSACGYDFQRFLAHKLMQDHEYHWSAPLYRGGVR